ARFRAETNCTGSLPAEATRAGVSGYLAQTSDQNPGRFCRARKMAAIWNCFRFPTLVRLQVAIALPLRNVLTEVVPLGLLRAGEALEDVIAESFPDQRVGLHLSHGLAQRRR